MHLPTLIKLRLLFFQQKKTKMIEIGDSERENPESLGAPGFGEKH